MKKLLNVERINKLGWSSKVQIESGLKETYLHFLNEIKSGEVRI